MPRSAVSGGQAGKPHASWWATPWTTMADLAEAVDDFICSFDYMDTAMDNLVMLIFIWMLFSIVLLGIAKWAYTKYGQRLAVQEEVKPPKPEEPKKSTANEIINSADSVLATSAKVKSASFNSYKPPKPSGFVPATPPNKRRLGRMSPGPEQLTLKKHQSIIVPTCTGPDQPSVQWVNELLTWLYNDLVIVNELVQQWIVSMNEFSKKSVEEDETVAAHRRTVINEWKREMGAPFIEMVGFEKIHQKQKFDRLLEVCVHDLNVCKAGDVAALCPNVRSIDVSRNLFSSWREVIQLSAQLPDLRELDVSKNRMAIDMPEETLIQQSFAFANLEKLNISVCDYEWSDLLALSHLWPNVQEVIAAYNRIKSITPAVTTLRSLTILRLDGNPIDSWYEVMNLGRLKNLRVLSLNDCRIQEIRLSDDPENKVDIFENLETLFLNRNMIKDWRSISELDKLKKLKRLYFLKNPIQNTEDYDTGSQLIIAKIGTLQELNGSTITRELRRGAEYDYMKRAGAEWKRAQQDPALKLAFQLEHCRFEQLINKYGIPEDSLLVKQTKTSTLTSQLLEITLRDDTGKSFKKKFPATMAVQKLVTLAQRLFSKSGNTGTKLYLLDDQMNGAEIHLDNVMKDLAYFSIKNGDIIVVRFR